MDADYDAAVVEGRTWVADADGEVAGVLVLSAEPDHLMIENVAVEPARQGTGIGRVLLEFAEQQAVACGLPELRLYTHVKMTENQALYTRLGYREVERRSESGFERVFMSKPVRA
jgi:ribosomal protein S18 acetylase RimI-like enzyme